MFGTIIFLSSIILFLSLMLNIKVSMVFDVSRNSLLIIIRVYNIKVVTIDIDIIGLHYRINNSKKLKTLSLILPKEQEYLIKQIKSSILDKLYYDRIEFASQLNLQNPALTAHAVGISNTISRILKSFFLNINKDMKITFFNTADFVDLNNEIIINIKVYFTIFDLVFAVITSFYKRGRYVKQKK